MTHDLPLEKTRFHCPEVHLTCYTKAHWTWLKLKLKPAASFLNILPYFTVTQPVTKGNEHIKNAQ